jgi:phosphonate transport system substrate-binding protein
MKKIIIYFLLLLNFISGCSKKEEIKNINLSKPKKEIETKIPKNAIRVGIASVTSPRESFLYYEELLKYIEKKIHLPMTIKYGKYKEIYQLLKYNDLELAFVCSKVYVEAKRDSIAELLVTPVIDKKTEYYSYIIVHKDSQIKKFSELKDKSFAFVDSLSTSGYLYPVYLLAKENKIYQTFFSKTIFTYSHDNSIIGVAEKLIDAAAVDSLVYDYLSKTNPQLISKTKIILKSPPFGIPPLIVNKNLKKELKDKLRFIFLNLHKEKRGKEILSKLRIEKFVPGSDKMYDSIRMMEEVVNARSTLNE